MKIIPATLEAEKGQQWFEDNLDKDTTRPYLKSKLKTKGLGRGVAQVTEHLGSKFVTLSSIASTTEFRACREI
jgi:hypothetical protein